MGCNCGGSQQRNPEAQRELEARAARERDQRGGGPGEPGYYFTGPVRPVVAPPANRPE